MAFEPVQRERRQPHRSAGPCRHVAIALAAAILTLSLEAPAQQTVPRRSDGVVVPYQSVTATDDASSIFVNPANLALTPGVESRLTVVWTGEDAQLPLRGYALDVALPFWILGTGLRVDWMDPPDGAPAPFSLGGLGRRYNWIRWAQSIRIGEVLSIGNTLAWSTAASSEMHGFFSATSAITVRPNRFVSASVVGRDWNTPENDIGRTIEPSVDMAAAFRPIGGRRVLELGLEGSYRSEDDRWVPSANASVALPYIGRLRLGGQLLDPSRGKIVIGTGVEVNFDTLQLTGGAVYGTGLSLEGTGFVAGGAVRLYRDDPKVPAPSRLVRLRIESTPTVRQHTRLLRTLWELADDPEVDGLLFVMRADPAPSLAHAEELVDALRLVRAKGKKVLCHLEDAGGRELFVCSEADRIAINPAGGLRFAGLASRYLYFGGLLEKLGVRADFVRIGKHKLAPEQFTTAPSEAGIEDRLDLLAQYERVYVGQIARGRDLELNAAKRAIAAGPFIASEARDHRLLDQLVYEDEIERFAEETFGHRVRIQDLDIPTEAPAYWQSPPKIAVVYLEGDMIDGHSQRIPIIDLRLAGSYTIAAALKQAREDNSVKAVVFRIETGGGSSLASDVILREATLTAKAKPLIVSMGSRAASGGYYASVAANEIFANRATLTGSIGIFYGKVDVVGLLDKIGVRVETLRTAPRADAESFFRPFTDEEHVELSKKVKQFYDLFIGRVATGRKMRPEEVHAVAQGRVWTGEQAERRGLVDTIGGLRQALARARELSGLPSDAPIVELPLEDPTLFERILQLAGVPSLDTGDSPPGWVPPPVLDVARALMPFVVLDPQRPMARMELFIEEP